jgi:hypothetical protein
MGVLPDAAPPVATYEEAMNKAQHEQDTTHRPANTGSARSERSGQGTMVGDPTAATAAVLPVDPGSGANPPWPGHARPTVPTGPVVNAVGEDNATLLPEYVPDGLVGNLDDIANALEAASVVFNASGVLCDSAWRWS